MFLEQLQFELELVQNFGSGLGIVGQNIGNLLQQVHGIAHAFIVSHRTLYGLIAHQEGLALQEISRYFRVWYELTGEAQNHGISPVFDVVCSAFARPDYTCQCYFRRFRKIAKNYY